MRFDLLGPLKVVHDGSPAPLRGTKQRAVLSYLLLHANEVVATSRLLKALWPDEVPPTARKMVQNSVSGLRTALGAPREPGDRALLLTHAPGYLLQVNTDHVDVTRFQDLVEKGRQARDDGLEDDAAKAFKQSLALWRGRALADLVETGVVWPELAALEDQRLSVHEDLFELELARGRHNEALPELEKLASQEPNRERLRGQLMTALYRCGRHVDALEVYRGTRTSLIEKLGLEPGKELRELERAILDHDDTLRLPVPEVAPRRPEPAAPFQLRSWPVQSAPEIHAVTTPIVAPKPVVTPEPEPMDLGARPSERKLVTVVGVTLADSLDDDPEDVHDALSELDSVLQEEVAAESGLVLGRTGSVFLAVFGVPRTHDDDGARAVRAALRVRDRLASGEQGPRLVVEQGEVLVKFDEDVAVPSVAGGVLDRCVRSTAAVADGTVRVSGQVRQASAGSIVYTATSGSPDWWQAETHRERPVPEHSTDEGCALVGRDHDLDMMRRMLDQVRQRRRAHLLTVLGEPGVGKSRLVAELGDVFGREHPDARVLTVHAPGAELSRLAQSLGNEPGLSPRLAAGLRALGNDHAPDRAVLFDTLRDCAVELTATGPLVVVVEDLHRADEEFHNCVGDLVDKLSSLPLLVIVTARPELLQSRPDWGGGRRSGTTLTLDPLSDEATAELLDLLLPAATRLINRKKTLIARIGGNPLFAVEYAREVRDQVTPFAVGGASAPPMPDLVRRLLTSRLDTLPAFEKAVLKDGSVFEKVFSPAALAELGRQELDEVTRCLETLETKELLVRAYDGTNPGEPVYSFRQPALREVAYQQFPRAIRAEKHRRATAWAAGSTHPRAEMLA